MSCPDLNQQKLPWHQAPWLIVGLGVTGWSVARYLQAQGQAFALADTRAAPKGLDEFCQLFQPVAVHAGPLDATALRAYPVLVVGPGVPLTEPALQQAVSHGQLVLGDVELFCRATNVPIVAITGSNGKSTVTTLVGEMARAAGWPVGVGGNLGTPALDLLQPDCDLYVLELSSFQLDTTFSLKARAATILNISADHLDRHGDLAGYIAAKQRIYRDCQQAVYCRDDPASYPPAGVTAVSFGLTPPTGPQDYGLVTQAGDDWLAGGDRCFLPCSELLLPGAIGRLNALAAWALAAAAGISEQAIQATLRSFSGLPHRCQRVACKQGVTYFNDSKATNLGAALAAIKGLEQDFARLWLILGGQGKGQDFSVLATTLNESIAGVALIGCDAALIEAGLPETLSRRTYSDLAAAVTDLAVQARPGDAVLLAPACASFDQFSGYAQRGEVFVQCVSRLPG